MAEKRAGAELRKGPRIAVISRFIEGELARWEDGRFHHDKSKLPYVELDQLFRQSVKTIEVGT